MTKLSVIIPMHNEEYNIPFYDEKLLYVIRYGCTIFPKNDTSDYEFIFVNDGSTDDTEMRLFKLMRDNPDYNYKLISYPKNMGMGYAIKRGFEAADGEYIATIDADMTYNVLDVIKCLFYIMNNKEYDCVYGSPYKINFVTNKIMVSNPTRWRVWVSRVNAMLYKKLLNSNVTCVTSLIRVYKKESLKKFTYESNGFDIQAEILCKFILNGMKVKEMPTHLGIRIHNESKMDVKKEVYNNLKLLYKIFKVKYLNFKW